MRVSVSLVRKALCCARVVYLQVAHAGCGMLRGGSAARLGGRAMKASRIRKRAVRARLQALAHGGTPPALLKLVFFLLASGRVPLERAYDFVEFFAGTKRLAAGFRAAGYAVNTFEKDDDEVEQNMLTHSGFCNAVALVLQTKAGGLNHFGIVCSSWIFLNRGTSKRSKTAPLGDTTHRYVRSANRMVSRCMLLVRLCRAQQVVARVAGASTAYTSVLRRFCVLVLAATLAQVGVVIENPVSTLIHAHPRFDAWLSDAVIFRVLVHLGRLLLYTRVLFFFLLSMRTCDPLRK